MRCVGLRSSKGLFKAALSGIVLLMLSGPRATTAEPACRALTASAQAIGLPSYFPLTSAGAASWTAMCNAAPAVGIALANVHNGPDDGTHGTNMVWALRIAAAHNAGLLVLGYVYTGYADPANPDFQTLAQVRTAVDNWYSWYPTIDGIFVDQSSIDPAKGQGPGGYYFQLSQHIRGKPNKHLVVVNQGGDAPDATYMALGDILVNFEGSYANFSAWSAPAWTDGFDAGRFWHLIHSVPSVAVADAVRHSRINNGGWVYATTETTNLWTALPNPTDWRTEIENVQPLSRWRASNSDTSLQYRMQYANTWTYQRVYIDTDRSSATGFHHGGIGANFLIENGSLYRYTGMGTNWSWSLIKAVTQTTGGNGDGAVNWSRWDLSRSDLGGVTATYLLFEVERAGGPLRTGYRYEHLYSATNPQGLNQYFGENDSTRFYFSATITPFWMFRQIYLDVDSSSSTGFRIGGIGADHLIENGNLYRYIGTGTNWNWALQGWIAHPTRTGNTYTWWIWRADVKGPGNSGMFFNQGGSRLVFVGNTGAPFFATPQYIEKYSP